MNVKQMLSGPVVAKGDETRRVSEHDSTFAILSRQESIERCL